MPFRDVVGTMLAVFALEESRCLGLTIAVPDVEKLFGASQASDANGLDQAS
jgi:hypothetical protein